MKLINENTRYTALKNPRVPTIISVQLFRILARKSSFLDNSNNGIIMIVAGVAIYEWRGSRDEIILYFFFSNVSVCLPTRN
jgi:hypothetical protein